MTAPRTAALLWSGGKDSALALHHARGDHPDLRVTWLVTCVSQAFDRVSMHGVRRALIADQAAAALGLPAGADPCGERGEYHTFATDGPPFSRPVRVRPGPVHRQPPFAFLELRPEPGADS